MTNVKIFYAWGITILTGALLIPLIMSTISEKVAPVILLYFIFMLMIPSITSLPALGAMLIVNGVNREKPFKTRFKRVVLTHVIAYLGLLTIGNVLIYKMGRQPYSKDSFSLYTYPQLVAFTQIITAYAMTASVVWIIMFRKDWLANKSVQKPVSNS